MKTANIRELSKKEKIKGLTRTAWVFSLIISGAVYPYIVFKSIFVAVGLIIFFFILEFFDDDILDILAARYKQRSPNEFVA
ncbi:hypothetical protein JWV37_10790 [Sulfurospirillum sp. T05]|uniref:Uncharacterized protein n=1 Tax=Sulfurospirillum tamanense TaxID=2813362 RepID=A0ABS2WUD2_9BACT|nr:hypothetical protein [Sulfurospirillum tamanensis]MBN2965269.1 hypothetical protein [Sulfurospirillum tamanensis]